MKRPDMSLLLGVLLATLLGEAGAVTCFAGNSSVPSCAATGCNGACIYGFGCYCGDGTSCLPSACDPNRTTCCPVGLFWHSDSSCCSEELNCEPACASDEVCTDNAGIGECRCNATTYLHAYYSDIVPTIQCADSAMSVSLKKCLLERFKYSIAGIHFDSLDKNCISPSIPEVVGSERWLRAQTILQAGWCGTEMNINPEHKTLTYSNILHVPPDTSSGVIISSSLTIPFSCTYNMTMHTSLQMVLFSIPEAGFLPSVIGSGSITTFMAAYMNEALTVPYTIDDVLMFGDPLYIGISTTFSDGDLFTLRADKCVASPSSNNPAEPGVLLISNGCPVTNAVDVQIIHNGDSLEVMFKIVAFAFPGQSEAYMSCDVSLCPKTTPDTCRCSSSQS